MPGAGRLLEGREHVPPRARRMLFREGIEAAPVLLGGCYVGRTAIDLSPVGRELSFGRVVRGMRSFGVKLPARDVDERAVREVNDSVSVRVYGAPCGILGAGSVAADPDGRRSYTFGLKRLHEFLRRDPALIVRSTVIGESWMALEEVIDVLTHDGEERKTAWNRN